MIVCCLNPSLYSMLILSLFRSCATLFSSSLPSSSPSHASPWWVLSLCNARSIPASNRCSSPFGICCSASSSGASGCIRCVSRSCWGIGIYVLLSPQLHLCSIGILLILLILLDRTCMLCLPCTNGVYRTSHNAIPSTFVAQNVLLLIELPRHLEVSSLHLSSELPSAVLAFLSPSLVALAVSSKSVLLLIQWMLSLGCCLHA